MKSLKHKKPRKYAILEWSCRIWRALFYVKYTALYPLWQMKSFIYEQILLYECFYFESVPDIYNSYINCICILFVLF